MRLDLMGRAPESFEEKRSFWELFTCRKNIWREYLHQRKRGEKCLVILLCFQIVFITVYVGLDVKNEERLENGYDIFNFILLLWLVIFSLMFLYNSLRRLLITELKIGFVCFTVMNIYTTFRYCMSCANIYNKYKGQVYDQKNVQQNDAKSKTEDVLNRIIYTLDIIGISMNFVVLVLYGVVTYFVYTDMRSFILNHLDGNRIMWNNFKEITQTRGILKLDFLANLEFFSCFICLLIKD